MFEAHALWVNTGGLDRWVQDSGIEPPPGEHRPFDKQGVRGKQADLQDADLPGADLRGRKLPGALMDGANLTGARLDGADLAYATLRGAILSDATVARSTFYNADLRRAVLQRATDVAPDGTAGTDLTGAKLQGADLRGADLSHARGLIPEAVGGSVLTGAKLPDLVAKFEALSQVAETSKNGSIVFVTMLAACGYSWLTIASTTDVGLITNRSTSPLPIAGTEIPIAGFYWAAPLILLGAFVYLHLYLQRLWQLLASLPAVFPDGVGLDAKAYPWLINAMVRLRFAGLHAATGVAARFETWLSVALAWFLVPLTLAWLWLRYLPRHDWGVTTLQIFIIFLSVWSGQTFYPLTFNLYSTEFGAAYPLRATQLVFSILAAIALYLLAVAAYEFTANEFPARDIKLWLILMVFFSVAAALAVVLTRVSSKARMNPLFQWLAYLRGLPAACLAALLAFVISWGAIGGGGDVHGVSRIVPDALQYINLSVRILIG
jgi:hypothetical protein